MTCGVYEITNTKNNKRYIGSSNFVFKRLHEHHTALTKGSHPNDRLQKDWAIFGKESFTFIPIDFCDNYSERETELLKQDDLYNYHKASNTVLKPKKSEARFIYTNTTKLKLKNSLIISEGLESKFEYSTFSKLITLSAYLKQQSNVLYLTQRTVMTRKDVSVVLNIAKATRNRLFKDLKSNNIIKYSENNMYLNPYYIRASNEIDNKTLKLFN